MKEKSRNEIAAVLDGCAEICADASGIADLISKGADAALRVIAGIRAILGVMGEASTTPERVEEKVAAREKIPEQAAPKEAAQEGAAGAGQGQPAGEYTKEEVRKFLAGIAKGHRDEVKALLGKYGAETLTQLDPAHYAAIMADAEVIADA